MSSTIKITERELDGCIIMDIRAESFTYPQTSILKTRIAELLDNGHRLFVLNCTEVQLADSYGLATIVSSLKMIKEHSGFMAMCGLNDMFNRLVELTHLDKVLEIWPSEAQATYYLNSQQNSLRSMKR
jgi:anti-anti-sigma factor